MRIIHLAIIIYLFLYNNWDNLFLSYQILSYCLESNGVDHLYMTNSGGRDWRSIIGLASGSGTAGSGATTGGPGPGGGSNPVVTPVIDPNRSLDQSNGDSNPGTRSNPIIISDDPGIECRTTYDGRGLNGPIDGHVNMSHRRRIANDLQSAINNYNGGFTLHQLGINPGDQDIVARVIQRNTFSPIFKDLNSTYIYDIIADQPLINMLRTRSL